MERALALVLALAGALGLTFLQPVPGADLYEVAFWALSGAAVSLISSIWAGRKTPYHLAWCYLFVTFFYGFGQVIAVAFGYTPLSLGRLDEAAAWVFYPSGTDAIRVSTISFGWACAAFTAAMLFFYRPLEESADNAKLRAKFGHRAWTILAVSLAAWFLLAMAGTGLSFLTMDYLTWLDRTGHLPFSLVYPTITLAMMVVGWSGTARRGPLILLLIWILVAFRLGLRNEVLNGAVMGFALLAGRIKLSPRWWLAVLALPAALWAASFIRFYRLDPGSPAAAVAQATPLDGLWEVGGSLQPLYQVVKYQAEGHAPMGGATYWAAVERPLLSRFNPFNVKTDAETDMRLMNVWVMDRAGPIGFSTVAEATMNFGPGAAPVILSLSVVVLVLLVAPERSARAAVIAMPFVAAIFVHSRQAFIGSLGTVIIGTAVAAYLVAPQMTRSEAVPDDGAKPQESEP